MKSFHPKPESLADKAANIANSACWYGMVAIVFGSLGVFYRTGAAKMDITQGSKSIEQAFNDGRDYQERTYGEDFVTTLDNAIRREKGKKPLPRTVSDMMDRVSK